MQLKLKDIRSLFRYSIMYQLVGIYFFVLVFVSISGYVGYQLYTLWDRLRILNAEVETYKTSIEFISRNKELLSEGVDSYNATLEKLVPDEESYFSVVSALEFLAQKTGVSIRSYTIDLESTNVSKLSLRVEVSGTTEALEKLLDSYRYSGGRLITIEKVEMSNTGEAVNVFLFNFYHQPYTVGASGSQQQITPNDIEFIEEISTQM